MSWRVGDLAIGFAKSPIAAALVLATAINCGGSTTAPAATAMLHGEVTDAIGDVFAGGSVANPPDLMHATADVVGGNLTFAIQLAPGTLDRQTTRVSVLLDTDQSAATGIRQLHDLGADYGIDLTASTGLATITKADAAGCAALLPSCFTAIGSASMAVGQDVMQVTVPLSLIGHNDGRLSFQIFSSAVVRIAPLSIVTFDAMPDPTAPAARVQ